MKKRTNAYVDVGNRAKVFTAPSSREPALTAVIVSGRARLNAESIQSVSRALALSGIRAKIMAIDRAHTADSLSIVRAFPKLRYLVPAAPLSFPQAVNLAMEESDTPLVLALNEDAPLFEFDAKTLFDIYDDPRILAVAPFIYAHGDLLQTRVLLSVDDGDVQTDAALPAEGALTLTSPSGAGLYYRDLFLHLGGFDGAFKNDSFATLDFFYRAYSEGFFAVMHPAFKIDQTLPADALSENERDLFHDREYFRYRALLSKEYATPGRSLLAKAFLALFSPAEAQTYLALLKKRSAILRARARREKDGARTDEEIAALIAANVRPKQNEWEPPLDA